MFRLFRRLRARLRNRRFDADLAEELRFHEDMKRRELHASGVSSTDATAAARRALGNVTLMREESRGVWIAPWLESIVQDVKYAVRTLARQPLHTISSMGVLVLAIGLNTSLFTAFKGVALEPWPARDPGRIIRIRAVAGERVVAPSFDEYRFIREQAKSFSGVAAYMYGAGMRLRAASRSESYPQTYFVSANFLDVLGARMHLGSGFIADDDLAGDRRSPAILSYHLWKNDLAADPRIIGQTITLNNRTFTVVGVLEPRIDGLSREVNLWLPLSALPSLGPVTPAGIAGQASGNCCGEMMARLGPGVDLSRARTELQLLHERFAAASQRKQGVVEVYGTAQISGPSNADLGLVVTVTAAVGLILVLACANVGNLQLARGLARRREIATRLSIGASRLRIVRQLLVEGMVLSSAAAAISVVVATVMPGVILRLAGDEIPPGVAGRFMPDALVVLFAAVVSVTACVAFALAPALHATRATIPLSSLDRGSTRGARFTLRGGLLAIQIAACTVLLAGAGLVTRAIAHALVFDPGFRIDGVSHVSAWLPSETPDQQRMEFSVRMLAELEQQLPGQIAAAHLGPLNDGKLTTSIVLPGENAGAARSVLRRGVSGSYFSVLGIPLVKGRMFPSTAVGEVVVNEAFARAYFGGEEPVGRSLREIDSRGAVRQSSIIVGVVRDAYLTGLERIDPVVFTPRRYGSLLVRGGPPAIERIRATAMGLSKAASVRAWPLSDDLHEYLEPSRAGAAIAWGIGLLGLALATVGVFGVFAYAVEERRREIGVRLALGAARRQIVGMLIATSGRAMVLGLGAGVLVSLACAPLLRSYLFGLSPLDPGAYGMVLALLASAATLATFVPARRACRVDPAVTLRED